MSLTASACVINIKKYIMKVEANEENKCSCADNCHG